MTRPATIIMRLSERSDGMGIATCGKHVATTRNGAAMKLARILKDAGVPDLPWEARRGTMVCMTGPSLHQLAGLTCSEACGSPRIVKWSAFEREEAA